MLKIGDKVNYLGMCYKVVGIKGDEATIKPLRVPARNPRARKALAIIKINDAKAWTGQR